MFKRSFKLIADKMMGFLTSDSNRKFNTSAVTALKGDLLYIESFAKKQPIKGMDDYFQELKQLLDLLLRENILDFLDSSIRKTQYHLLTDKKKLLSILEKYKENAGLGAKLFGTSRTKQIDKVKSSLPSLTLL